MNSYNKVILLGNLTRDPQVSALPTDGSPVATFGLALNEVRKVGDEKKETVSYIDIVVYGVVAGNCGKYLHKGDPVLIEGKLRQRRWDDRDTGAKRSKVEVVAASVNFIPKGSRQQTADGRQESGDVPHNVGQVFPDAEAVGEDEIPF